MTSSVLTILMMMGAGMAAASQGGVADIVNSARSAVDGSSDGSHASGTDGSATGGGSGGTGSGAEAGSGGPVNAASCAAAVASVKADMPTAGNPAGINHAIDVVTANCQKNPQAHGLLNALNHMAASHGNGKGHAGSPPGQSGNPGHSGAPPGESGNPPPSHSGDPQGHSGDLHGHSGDPHGGGKP